MTQTQIDFYIFKNDERKDYDDIPLEDLIYKENLSKRSVNVCFNQELLNLEQIVNYYLQNGSFNNLRNCGVKSDIELVKICKKYQGRTQTNTNSIPDKNIKDVSIKDLIYMENLSARTFKICLESELLNLSQIINFYLNQRTFSSLRSCGTKSNLELVKICKKYIEHILNDNILESIPEKDFSIVETINSLSLIQKITLNQHFEYLLSNLTTRSVNGLWSISTSHNHKEIFEKIFSDGFNFKSIKNLGNKSIIELEKFLHDLLSFINTLISFKEEQLNIEYTKLIIKKSLADLPLDFATYQEQIIDENSKIKLFKLINILVKSGKLFNEVELKIFNLSFSIKKSGDFNSVANEFNLSRERIRQIKKRLEANIKNYFTFIFNFNKEYFSFRLDTFLGDFKVLDKTIVDKINEIENVDFNITFYGVIFGLLLNKTHVLLWSDCLNTGQSKNIRNMDYLNNYLIKTSFFEEFSFELFMRDIFLKINERRNFESYSLNFKGYLREFFKNEKIRFFEEIEKICNEIIYREFDFVVKHDGYLYFEQNTKKLVQEYYYQILEEHGDKMRASEIVKIANELYPFLGATISSVRGILNKERDKFICFSRTSTFGLRKWEKEKENLKGGSIRNIVFEYLSDEISPKHISEVLDFILRYRPDTNKRSLLTNLKLEETNKFTFYKGDFIGLSEKTYNKEALDFRKMVGSRFQISVFKRLKGLHFDDIVKYFVKTFNYKEEQVKLLIQEKISEGLLTFTNDNTLI